MRGAIAYRPLVRAPDGSPGTYPFDFQPRDSFSVELPGVTQMDQGPFVQSAMGSRNSARMQCVIKTTLGVKMIIRNDLLTFD